MSYAIVYIDVNGMRHIGHGQREETADAARNRGTEHWQGGGLIRTEHGHLVAQHIVYITSQNDDPGPPPPPPVPLPPGRWP